MELTHASATVRGSSMTPFCSKGILSSLGRSSRPKRARSTPSGPRAQGWASRTAREPERCGRARLFQGDTTENQERLPADTRLSRVVRLLNRRQSPASERVVFGLARHLEALPRFRFPAGVTLAWDWEEIFRFAQTQRLLAAIAYSLRGSRLWEEVPARGSASCLARDSSRVHPLGEVCRRARGGAQAAPARAVAQGRAAGGGAVSRSRDAHHARRGRARRRTPARGEPRAAQGQRFSPGRGVWRERSSLSQVSLTHLDTGVCVELHWGLFTAGTGSRFSRGISSRAMTAKSS